MEVRTEKGFVSYAIDSAFSIDRETGDEVETSYILIALVYTKPEYRGQGAARQMLADAIATIKAEYPEMAIRLCALPKEDCVDQDRLVAFYETVGFDVDDEQGYDGVFMTYSK